VAELAYDIVSAGYEAEWAQIPTLQERAERLATADLGGSVANYTPDQLNPMFLARSVIRDLQRAQEAVVRQDFVLAQQWMYCTAYPVLTIPDKTPVEHAVVITRDGVEVARVSTSSGDETNEVAVTILGAVLARHRLCARA
jgi:hypothetical protein